TPVLDTTTIYYVSAAIIVGSLNCEGPRQPVVATVEPTHIVDIGNDTTICSGKVLTLDAGHSGQGAVYIWSNSDTSQTIAISTGGKYYVQVTIEDCVASDTVTVTALPSPVVNLGNDTIICDGTTLYLSGGNPGASFLWSDNATTSTLMVNTGGIYYVAVTNS